MMFCVNKVAGGLQNIACGEQDPLDVFFERFFGDRPEAVSLKNLPGLQEGRRSLPERLQVTNRQQIKMAGDPETGLPLAVKSESSSGKIAGLDWSPGDRLLFHDPDVSIPYILTVLLQFQSFGGGAYFDAPVGVLDGHVVVDFESIPPDGGPGRLD